ncbi:MAG: S66 peptidase family protein [Bacillota bacterium]
MSRIKPRPVSPGGLIGIVAPSSPVDPAALAEGIARLQAFGYRVLVGEHVLDQKGHLAGEDAARAADFNRIWANPEVEAVLCARGGYGAMRMLEQIDWELVRRHPKFFCGFSDVTALHLAMAKEADLVTFHGPMVAAFGEALVYNAEGLLRAMQEREPLGEIAWPAPIDGQPPRPVTLRPGVAEGRLMGGNLSLLVSLIGTRWEPDLDGSILLLEEVDEPPYRVDRMLTQLRLAGKLQGVRGVLFGDSPSCLTRSDGRPSHHLHEVLGELLGDLSVPLLYGFPCGHTAYRATLPLGVRVRLDAAAGSLTILEPALA